ncbi:uncharacterized protein LOC132280829 [Cornus florida]|uniref:uncharacterized protein LOC132280829 n=1 Tax=Cornus florida TaxID=4283 RepID=UPI00289AAAFA|nr:uncharacterized protein LOC132280829 [Cornus florida]
MVVCTEVQKQMLATFMLIGNALQWWESIITIEERTRLTYAEFQTRFDSKYFPLSVRSAMNTDFLDLQQGDMTVAEYEQRFINLSLFAPEEGDKRADTDFTHQTVERGSSSGTKFNDRGRVQGHQPWKKNKGNTEVQRDGVPNQGRQVGVPQTGQEQFSGNQQRRQIGPFQGRCYHSREIGHPANMCPKAK